MIEMIEMQLFIRGLGDSDGRRKLLLARALSIAYPFDVNDLECLFLFSWEVRYLSRIRNQKLLSCSTNVVQNIVSLLYARSLFSFHRR